MERDIRDVLRERPMTIGQSFEPLRRLHLLCPPDEGPASYEAAKIAFGPFTTSVLCGFVTVTVPARMDEAQDLWNLVQRDAMPDVTHREPGGEPVASLRTAVLGWRLLALLGGAVEMLAAASSAVRGWRASGQPTGLECPLGPALLTYRSEGADGITKLLSQFASPDAASALFGYPSDPILSRYVPGPEAALIAQSCDRSSGLLADIYSLAASIVVDPFWRTFAKWKHGAIATSPGVGPMWVNQSDDLDTVALEDRLASGIVVFDAQGGPNAYIWPTQRVDLIAYSTMTIQILQVAEIVIWSVLGYARPAQGWPIALFEIDEAMVPAGELREALDHLAASAYPVAALAGLWRDPPNVSPSLPSVGSRRRLGPE